MCVICKSVTVSNTFEPVENGDSAFLVMCGVLIHLDLDLIHIVRFI